MEPVSFEDLVVQPYNSYFTIEKELNNTQIIIIENTIVNINNVISLDTQPTNKNADKLSLGALFTNLNKTAHDLTSQLSLVKSELKQLEKFVGREMRVLDKFNARKNRNKGHRAPSGFVKPTKISDELATFLGKEPGTLMARTDVTKQITSYIRSNSLQDKANGRLILADDKLKKLLNYDEKNISDPSQQLSYFNLQRYLSGHFEKSVS